MTRQVFILSSSLLALLLGCTRYDQSGETRVDVSGPPSKGDWIIVRFEAEPDNLNPHTSATAVAQRTYGGANNSNIYESLLQMDTRDWATPVGLLAEARPEVSKDHLTYTFTIRDGVQWHDGKPLTSEDVYFSFKAVASPLVDSAPLRSHLSDLTNVEKLEDRKVRLTVRKPYFMNEIVLGQFVFIIPKHIFDPEGLLDGLSFTDIISPVGGTNSKVKQFAEQFNKHPNNRTPIGTGPYKFERWDTGREIVLVRNDEYWGKKGYLDKIVYRIITDNTTALAALKAGEVDFNPRLTAVQYAEQTSGPAFEQQFRKGTYTVSSYGFIAWNQERVFFKDKRVRQALTMLVDRQAIVEKLRLGLGQVAVSPFSPGGADFNTDIQPLPYDPQRAAELLDESGWLDHNRDGIRDKAGIPFRFEMLGSSSSAITGQLMSVLKEEFRKVGIDMTERRIESTVFVNSQLDHRFDAAISAWIADLVQDPYQIWHSDSIPNRGSNWVSFRNAEADRLIEEARTEFDAEKRRQLFWKFQEIVHEEQPYTFLYYPQEAAAYHRRFQNVKFVTAQPGYDLRDWFVPKLAQKYKTTSN